MKIGVNLLYLLPEVVGGTETYAEGLLQGFHQLAPPADFVVFLNRESRDWPLPQGGRITRYHCDVSARSRTRRYAYEQLVLPHVLRRQGIALVHSLAYVGPLRPPCPSVVSIHDLNYRAFGHSIAAQRRLALKFFVRASAVRARQIVTLSEFSRGELVRAFGLDPARITVTPAAAREPCSLTADAIQATLSAHDIRAPFAIAYGSTSPNKNIGTLLKAWRYARRTLGSRALLVLVGHLPSTIMSDELTRELLHDGALRVTGYVSRPESEALLRSARVLVFPSLYEGFGLPVVEAMQASIPVICSPRASLPEVGGDAVRYIDPTDPSDIAKAIIDFMRDDAVWDAYRRLGSERAKQFSWVRTAARTWEVYASLLPGTPALQPSSAISPLATESVINHADNIQR